MRDDRTFRRAAAWAAMLMLASCAKPVKHVAVAPPPPAPEPERVPARPMPPMGSSATTKMPMRAADGSYMTINRNVAPAEAAWHLRAGLNVAALGCPGANGVAITATYNAMLRSRAKQLAAAETAIKARTRAERRGDWQDAHDDRMTQLYNFYALPPVQSRFCKVAAEVAAREPGVPADQFQSFATTALDELSAPFNDFYAAYDSYRVALADWEARYGAGATRVAVGTPVPLAAPAAAVVDIELPQAEPAVERPLTTSSVDRRGTPRLAYVSLAEVDGFGASRAASCSGCRSREVAAGH